MSTDVAPLAARLESLLGAGRATTIGLHRWVVDGVTPRVVVRPADAEQIGAVLRICSEAGTSVLPWGGGTAIELGNPPRSADVILLTDRLSHVVEHDHSNLTVTVQAGVTLDALARVLAARRQFLPLEPPRADLASAGGTAAANLNGPRRLFYGGVRDLIIGIRVVQADGVAIRWGGKTVKNVAGYDMCKLFVGSLGTLGLITELTFKVLPLPEASRTLMVRGPDAASVLRLAGHIRASPLLPAAMSAVNPEAGVVASRMAWGLLVRTEGFEAAVARHERDITAWAGQAGMDAQVLSDDLEATAWRGVRDFGWDASGVVIRLSAPPAAVPQVLEAVTALLPAAGMVAHLGTGTIWIRAALADLSPEALSGLRDLARRHDGHLLLARAPRHLKDSGDVWFPGPQALSLMQGLKQAFDPHGILNPGRFIAGL